MNSLSIPISSIKVTNENLIGSILPQDICWLRRSDDLNFEVMVGGMVCANISIKNDQLNLVFAEQGYPGFWGSKLKEYLIQKFPDLDSDRIVWQIFVRSGIVPASFFNCFNTKEEALATLKQYQVNMGAYLCSLKAKFIGQRSFWTETAYPIDRNFLPRKNLGSIKITMENLTRLEGISK